jgi:glyoxylase-like metal-dependent hydrolase (beta-lactamase superfamily II)
MSAEATHAAELAPGIFSWQAFSPEHKCELTSTAVEIAGRLFVFDPIPLAAPARDQLLARGPLAAIVLTNANHERAADEWRARTGAAVWASADAPLELSGVRRIEPPAQTCEGWEAIPLSGGAPGEIALRREELSLVVLGDAVFDLPGYGFGILPEKYCQDRARLLAGLRLLAGRPFARAALAHGGPLRADASRRIGALLPIES